MHQIQTFLPCTYLIITTKMGETNMSFEIDVVAAIATCFFEFWPEKSLIFFFENVTKQPNAIPESSSIPLFVNSIDSPQNKMQGHFRQQLLTQSFMPFHMVPSVLLSMVALITTYFKESDWLLKNFHQSKNGSNSYYGEQNRGYHVTEHTKL